MDNSCKNRKLLTNIISNNKGIKFKLISFIFTSDEKERQNTFWDTQIDNNTSQYKNMYEINDHQNIKIQILDDTFQHTNENGGEKLNILLTNHSKRFQDNDVEVLRLVTLISSVIVFQFSEEILDDDLELLFKYSKFLNDKNIEENQPKNLFFIITDWNNAAYDYGIEGGQKYLDNLLNKIEENKRTNFRKILHDNFKNIGCSLIPKKDLQKNTYTDICLKTKDRIIQTEQKNEKHFNGSELLNFFDRLNEKFELYKYLEVIVSNQDNKSNHSKKSFEIKNKSEQGECSFNDSKRLKAREGGVYYKKKHAKKYNNNQEKLSSDEELEEQQFDDHCARSCQQISLNRKSSRPRKIPTRNEHKAKLNSSLDSLSDIHDAILDLQRNKRLQFEELDNFQDQFPISQIPEDILILILEYLNNEDKINLLFASIEFVERFADSNTILKDIFLNVNKQNCDRFFKFFKIHFLPLKNLSLNFGNVANVKDFLPLLRLFENLIKNLEIKNAEFKNFNEILEIFGNIPNVEKIYLENCKIKSLKNEDLTEIPKLSTIFFNKCDDNMFKVFINQKFLENITVRNDDWTWAGFPHEIFNQIATNAKNLQRIKLFGSGTGSFFDSDSITFKVKILDTTMISFHWYVGIRTGRTSFLKSQKGFLKELTIHQLPFDFDGGKVLKYITEEMNLDKFYYGDIPLILNGQKQEVKKFSANEIQIQSIFEMFRQFTSITLFCFIINETDIASDAIEAVINPHTNLFDSLQEFEVIDNSKYRSTFGVFLGLMKNFRNIKKLSLRTQDRNINTLLGEFLPIMTQLTEIFLPSKAPRSTERFEIIRMFVPNLTKISVQSQFIQDAKTIFGENVDVISIDDNLVIVQ